VFHGLRQLALDLVHLGSSLLQGLPVQIDPSEKKVGFSPLQRQESQQASGGPGQSLKVGGDPPVTRWVLRRDGNLYDLQLCLKKVGKID
jgi:hypothetical protein